MEDQIVILADDLTSATDCSAAFAAAGKTVHLVRDWERLSSAPDSPVVAIDLDTRNSDPNSAYTRTRRAAETLCRGQAAVLFKSVDSTLRGNIGAETQAIVDAVAPQWVPFIPAFPIYGRTTVGGQHRLHGAPLEQTELAADPRNAVRDSCIARLLGRQSSAPVGAVSLRTLRAGRQAIPDRLQALCRLGARVIIFDVETEADLQRATETLLSIHRRSVWVGSTGLARHVARLLHGANNGKTAVRIPAVSAPVLAVAGSPSELTRRQIEELRRQCLVVELNPMHLDSAAATDHEIQRCVEELHSAVGSRRDACLCVAPAVPAGFTSRFDPKAIADALGRITATAAHRAEIGALVLTGGDTARAVFDNLGLDTAEVLTEFAPGVPVCRVRERKNLLLVTKAGKFGTPRTLAELFERLHEGM